MNPCELFAAAALTVGMALMAWAAFANRRRVPR